MRKLIFHTMVSLDGYFEGPNGELDWHHVDTEWNEYSVTMLNSADVLIFGRKTYELMNSYWPTDMALTDDPGVAALMNSKQKIVFSKTLQTATWQNTTLLHGNVKEEIHKLKQERGEDIILMGSSDLAVSFIEYHLIDEFRIAVNPIALGAGKTLFHGMNNRLELVWTRTENFNSGLVMMYYRQKRN